WHHPRLGTPVSVPTEDHGASRTEPSARAVHAGQTGVGDLAATTFIPQLLDRLDKKKDPSHAGLARREASPIGVGGECPADTQPPIFDECASLALLAKPQALQRQD